MKKQGYLFVGILVGAAISFSLSAYGAETSLVGKKIQGEKDLVIQYEPAGKVIIVDGRSYAPVRLVGESAGYDVAYTGKQVIMVKPGADPTQSSKAE
ncbi:hypothetical protein DNH61_21790 [Paenibacillus sambharensis]|uniref:Copper amine oxidase-like N-terminal domain-containing protein n=1 Tax=Paenibacillus sambharensis TaxID=1803190 RepID=A0A2W1L350_9BACL|nr:hypothetical protein [Paenibacillus sambharensis]PZD93279.1 hypothetical protein DNH61_21790 [Paenibacillus sambharensis]